MPYEAATAFVGAMIGMQLDQSGPGTCAWASLNVVDSLDFWIDGWATVFQTFKLFDAVLYNLNILVGDIVACYE